LIDYLSSIWLVGLISLAYVGFLFVLAILGDRIRKSSWQPYVYSLTLAIFCTTWAFYGTVEQTVRHGWLLAPTYLGAIVLITVGRKTAPPYRILFQHALVIAVDWLY